jgi:hypothetical protein
MRDPFGFVLKTSLNGSGAWTGESLVCLIVEIVGVMNEELSDTVGRYKATKWINGR